MTLEKLFGVWESMSDFAGDVGESHWTVLKWKQRKRIPSAAWPKVIAAANRKGNDISADDLLTMHGGAARRAASR